VRGKEWSIFSDKLIAEELKRSGDHQTRRKIFKKYQLSIRDNGEPKKEYQVRLIYK